MDKSRQVGLRLLDRYIALVEHRRWFILVFFLAASGLALVYVIHNLGMNTDTKDMLSPKLPWRQLDLEYERHFPQYADTILVVVEAETPDQAADAAHLIHTELQEEQSLFKSIYYARDLSLFRQDALLFLETDELYELSDNLARIQPLLTRLTDDMSLRGLFAMLSDAIHAIESGDDIEIGPLITALRSGIDATRTGATARVSWQGLINNELPDQPPYREFILLQPELDYGNILPAGPAMDRLREIAGQSGIVETGAQILLTGNAALSHEELTSVTRGTELAMLASLVMVTLIMIVGLKSIRLVIYTLLSLCCGLLLTAAFATWAIGKLNLISVAFAVLYIGLGIDFAIHYCLRYRELRLEGKSDSFAIGESSRNLGHSLFICTVTTALGFFAFIPTDYRGVAELGLISGVGMFISLFVTLTLLPALLGCLPLRVNGRNSNVNDLMGENRLVRLPVRHTKTIRWCALLVLLIALGLVTQQRFDPNTLNLQDPDTESTRTYRSLLESSDTSPWTGVIVARDRQDVMDTMARLQDHELVDHVVWLEDFVPQNQDEKLAIVDKLNLLLPGGFATGYGAEKLTPVQQYRALHDFLERHYSNNDAAATINLQWFGDSLQSYVNSLESMPETARAESLATLSETLLASLPGRLQMLDDALDADYVSVQTLPGGLRSRWLSDEGAYLLNIYPTQNLNDTTAMRRFVEELGEVDQRLIGLPVINIEGGDAVVRAFAQALAYALCAITLFLVLLLPRRRDTLYILGTLLFAVIVTGGMSVLLSIPLNFANIIALPLLLGIGVDSSIHILHRFRTAAPGQDNILTTSSARAVTVSALTTMCSIGNLAFSPHTGTASMGKLLTLGIGMTLVATLLVLPGFLVANRSR